MLSDYCIYTIRHSGDLREARKKGGTYTERKRWVQGKLLLEAAQHEGKRLPIVFAPAEATGALYGWAVLDTIVIDGGETTYSFSGLKPLKGHRKTSLKKKRSGNPLSPGFIRPYAICRTPAYLRG